MRIIFMGTPQFAVPSLQVLIDSEHTVIAVVCQPDKPVGRKQLLTPPPVKQLASAHDITVLQPQRIRANFEFYNILKNMSADLICVTAYGKILPVEILELPKLGCINVHASILPKYRGAAPINWAIINGENKTGITTMLMDEGMDTGDMLLKKEIEILDEDTSITLSEKLSVIGAELLIETIKGISDGKAEPVSQCESEATYAPMLKKEDGRINWNLKAFEIRNRIRGLLPWPVAYTFLNGRMLKIFSADTSELDGPPGTIIKSTKSELVISAGEGSISLSEVQLEGNRKMDIRSFQAGRNIEQGTSLDSDV